MSVKAAIYTASILSMYASRNYGYSQGNSFVTEKNGYEDQGLISLY